jgi:hypothetical protein
MPDDPGHQARPAMTDLYDTDTVAISDWLPWARKQKTFAI